MLKQASVKVFGYVDALVGDRGQCLDGVRENLVTNLKPPRKRR
jgi:hypothetical protein